MRIETQRRATAEDALNLHRRTGVRYEVVEGEPREMPPTGGEHGGIETWVTFLLQRHVIDHPIGRVFVGEVLCRLKRDPDTARVADVAFMRKERLPNGQLPVGPVEGAPDLVVEIVSPSDTAGEIQEKISQWLAGGATVVWALYPGTRGVVVWRATGASPELRQDAEVDAEPVLPGFRCRAADLFGD